MFRVLTLNQISLKGLERFSRSHYEVASEFEHPDAILLRSFLLNESKILPTVKAIARAGAGVNNIPVEACTNRGIPVFNTPGANANAVKELVLSALLLSSRGILEGMAYVQGLKGMTDSKKLNETIEQDKKKFSGNELAGKTLGVVGLGAIGSLVAETGLQLGMEVLGYDPAISVDAAWRLSRQIQKMENLHTLLSKSDYVSLHLPVLESTKNLINLTTLKSTKPKMRLINFSREEIVNSADIVVALNEGKLGYYISDFPTPELIQQKNVLLMPHIGASTQEAEENCAVMAANQIVQFLEHGNIKNSVNFPEAYLERTSSFRIALANKNVPKILGKVLSILADRNINVIDMLNKSRGEIAYNLIDIETSPTPDLLEQMRQVEDVINVRFLER